MIDGEKFKVIGSVIESVKEQQENGSLYNVKALFNKDCEDRFSSVSGVSGMRDVSDGSGVYEGSDECITTIFYNPMESKWVFVCRGQFYSLK